MPDYLKGSAAAGTAALKEQTGIVIPVFFPERAERGRAELATGLLRDTVRSCLEGVGDKRSVCLSVDGERCGAEIAAALERDYGVTLTVSPTNRGKLWALRHGMGELLQRSGLEYLAVVDADGDHFPYELLNMLRTALVVRADEPDVEALILGSRRSRHRPLGFLRGELEEIADRVLLDALQYDAATRGQPFSLEYATAIEEFPDFHSGFKLFSRATAQAVFAGEPQLCGVSEDAYFRHGCEAVMCVEAIRSGARLAAVARSAMNEQPVSTFGMLERTRLVADKMVWPCKRLGVPAAFVDQWLRNHMPRLLLPTLVPQGHAELAQIRRLVLEGMGFRGPLDDDVPARSPFI